MRGEAWVMQTSSSSVGRAPGIGMARGWDGACAAGGVAAGWRARAPVERAGPVAVACVTRPAARIPALAIHPARMVSASRDTAGWGDRAVRGDGCDLWIRLCMNLQVAGAAPSGVAGAAARSGM